MERHVVLMQEIWRETCRHIEIAGSTALIAARIRSRMLLRALVVRRLDRERRLLETVGGPDELGQRSILSQARVRDLDRWLEQERCTRIDAGQTPPVHLEAALEGMEVDTVLAAPLTGEGDVAGVLLLAVDYPAPVDDYLVLADLLREPLTTALENDFRLAELHALREAAEADKQSLLTRLGRDRVHDAVVGAEGGLRGVMDRVEMAARSDVPVLILGETGAGKEVIARAIHERSGRVRGPLFRVNCGAIPPELIDSELFGHEKGSFTGATATRRGWFERAGGGTLFMDEVGELTPAAQVRLLRVLQDGSYQRVGGERNLQADVRVIAATNRNLAEMVREGDFREDLWYRVAVFPLLLPPLRDRKEDIPALACELSERAARRYGLRSCRPTADQLAVLSRYSWPGNVRELGSVIDRAAILGNGVRLEIAAALGGPVLGAFGDGQAAAAAPSETFGSTGSSGSPGLSASTTMPADPALPPLDLAMARHIERALAATAGRIEGAGGAAELLRINPHTLRARMRKLGVDWTRFRRGR